MLDLEPNFRADHNPTSTPKLSLSVRVETLVPFLELDMVDFASCNP